MLLPTAVRRSAALLGLLLSLGCGNAASAPSDPRAIEPAPSSSASSPVSDAAPPATYGEYPAGPYGFRVGQTFPDISIDGYIGAAGDWKSIALADYYDPDGARGVRGLYLTVSAPWCPACVSEAKTLPAAYASTYRGRGARLLTVLPQDGDSKPATRATIDAWIASFKTNYDIAADPALLSVEHDASGGGTLALPYNYVIDPRTMKIVQINSGAFFVPGGIPGLDALLKKNGG